MGPRIPIISGIPQGASIGYKDGPKQSMSLEELHLLYESDSDPWPGATLGSIVKPSKCAGESEEGVSRITGEKAVNFFW